VAFGVSVCIREVVFGVSVCIREGLLYLKEFNPGLVKKKEPLLIYDLFV